ncbi:MAG: GreA/GreB family elongation factor, partial [Spirochaetia bacterium]|nr:GreA/GreB family elongation factor [Spirochaetia bacterium]
KKLKEEIGKAQVFDKSKLNLNKVSFGTKVTMLNLDTDKNVVYTILGPWESDPEKNIISYKAPLGLELMDSEKDEELHFEINGTRHNIKVVAIEASEFI